MAKCKNYEVCHNQAKKHHTLCDRCIAEAERMDRDWLTIDRRQIERREIENARKRREPA